MEGVFVFKIGEFSKLTKVSIRMLRYYDEVGLLKPAMTDRFTGYRLYSTSQIPTLQKILLLRDMEFNVAEIAAVLDQWNTTAVTTLLTAKKNEILEKIRFEQQRVQKIDMAIQDIGNRKIAAHYNVIIKSVPCYRILSCRDVIPDYFCEGTLWEKLYAFVEAEKIELVPGINNLAVFHDEEHPENGIDVEVCVQVKKTGENQKGFVFRETEAVSTMACVMVYGPYENIGPAYHAFACWLEEHQQYEMTGLNRQICHIGAFSEENPQNFLTELQIPIGLRIS